jgi:hypothetical protein
MGLKSETRNMANWDRNTPWRQGQLLTADAVKALGLNDKMHEDMAVVVISHDCDLAQPSTVEPLVEVIVGRFLKELPDGNYTHCKNLRRLHLECTAGSFKRAVELEILARTAINKDSTEAVAGLSDFEPCVEHRMATSERNELQHWLAARYKRAAFPDEFDRRLKDQTGIAEKLAKAFKSSGKSVVAVFFDVDGGDEKARQTADDPYELRIILLYQTANDPDAAKAAATIAAQSVKAIFEKQCAVKCQDATMWTWIELIDVEVVSDQAMTYVQSQQLLKWHADHISLRSDPEQPMLGL